jgi:uracil phosphoribosyltransferase
MPFVEHHYPKQVKILDDPYLTHLCGLLSTHECQQPQFNQLIKRAFQQLFIHVMNNEWPQIEKTTPTRMTDLHPEVRLTTRLFDQQQRGVCVDVARAGMLPTQIFFDELNQLIAPEGNRQDHVFASRATNSEGEVTHTELSSSKIGGDIEQAIVMIPDPMGATGSSLCEVIQFYKDQVKGQAKKYVAVHMIITPEYIQKVTETHPDVQIYAARLDRGFSSENALSTPPGTHWNEEKGLNDNQYIVPGAGGVGELINNSFV